MTYQLEKRLYSREEFGQIAGISPTDAHFKRKAETFLINCGYAYYDDMRKGVEIAEVPNNVYDKLREILYRFYGIDMKMMNNNGDLMAFSIFLCSMLQNYDGFAECPWKERVMLMKTWYGIEVCERTLQRWNKKLVDRGLIVKSDEKTYWKTNLDKSQVEVDIDDPERAEYWKDYWQLVREGKENVPGLLWDKYGACYYACRKFDCSAWDNNEIEIVDTIFDLVTQINILADKGYEDRKVVKAETVTYRKPETIIKDGEFRF